MTKATARQHAIIEEASSWVTRLDDADEPLTSIEQYDLAEWLLLSPTHIQELLFCAATFQALGDISVEKRVPLEALIKEKAPDVLPLFAAQGDAHKEMTARKQYRLWKNLAAIAAIVMVVILAQPYFAATKNAMPSNIHYNTVTGEQRSVSLIDGSVIHLNTGSKVIVTYRDTERAVQLVEGEALFKVAHDKTRPFRVYAGSAIAEAIGTTFNVYRKAGQTSVAVVEGKVKVTGTTEANTRNASSDDMVMLTPAPVFLTKGQETAVTLQGGVSEIRPREADIITSWRDRRLIFENEYLSDIAEEFNRYNVIKLIIDDVDLARTQFDGVFDANDPDAFVNFLQLAGGIEVVRTGNNKIVLTKSTLPGSENNKT